MLKHLVLIGLFGMMANFNTVNAKELVLATTTSTKSSGLLNMLIPAFEKDSGYSVKVYTVGTGKALRLGRQGKVDVLLVHAPQAEKQFVQDGDGVLRTPVMKNDFVIVGPKTDPAQINAMRDARQALEKVRNSNSLFISRADDSGTHKKEMSLWESCEIEPYGDWYFELGASMGETLKEANRQQAYVMIDRGTWLAARDKIELDLHVEGDPLLENPYSIIAVNPKKHKFVNFQGAKTFIAWMTGKQGQQVISQLMIGGEQLFTVTVK